MPETHNSSIPKSVSIVANQCDKATNNLKVIYNPHNTRRTRGKFAVCSKGLIMLNDSSSQFTEWFEVLKALGAEKVSLYVFGDLHINLKEVLLYLHVKYVSKG